MAAEWVGVLTGLVRRVVVGPRNHRGQSSHQMRGEGPRGTCQVPSQQRLGTRRLSEPVCERAYGLGHLTPYPNTGSPILPCRPTVRTLYMPQGYATEPYLRLCSTRVAPTLLGLIPRWGTPVVGRIVAP